MERAISRTADNWKKIQADSVINFHPLPVMGGLFELTEEIRT